MDDLISRQAALEAIKTAELGCEYEAVEALPSAEKHGRWIQENIVLTTNPVQYQWHCSECGVVKHWFTSEVLTNYCPNCGADMRGKNDG